MATKRVVRVQFMRGGTGYKPDVAPTITLFSQNPLDGTLAIVVHDGAMTAGVGLGITDQGIYWYLITSYDATLDYFGLVTTTDRTADQYQFKVELASVQSLDEDARAQLSATTYVSLSSTGMDSISLESGINARQGLALILDALVAILTGAATTNVKIYNATTAGSGIGSTLRIDATVDADGNRSAVVIHPPA